MNTSFNSNSDTDSYRILFQDLYQGLEICRLIYDENGKPVDYIILDVNNTGEILFELKRKAILGKTVRSIIPDIDPEWLKMLDSVVRTGESVQVEVLVEPTGRLFDIQAISLQSQSNFAIIYSDITDRRHNELNIAVLDEISKEIMGLFTSEEALDAVGKRICKYLKLSGCQFIDVDVKKGEAIVNYEWLADSVLGLKDGFQFLDYFNDEFSRLLGAGKPFIVTDTKHDNRVAISVYEKQKIGAFVAIPYHWQGHWTRVVSAIASEPRYWREDEIKLLVEVSDRLYCHIERIRVIEELSLSEERYRTLFESIDEGFAIMEALYDKDGIPCDGRYIEVNKAFEQMTGLKNLAGKWLSEVLPDVQYDWHEINTKVNKTGEVARHEYRGKRNKRWYSAYISRINGDASHQYAVILNDITERKLKELRQVFRAKLIDAMLSQSSEQSIQNAVTRLLVEHLDVSQSNYADYNDEFITINYETSDGTLSISGKYERTALPAELEILKSGKEIIFEDSMGSGFTEVLKDFFISMNIRANITVPILRKGELVATLSVRQSTPRKWANEEIDLVRETADRTWITIERIRAEKARRTSEERAHALVKKLEDLDKNKNQFINILSHELRNPLAVMMTGLELLQVSKSREQMIKVNNIIYRQVNQLSTLVDSLLDLTRITNNRIELHKDKFELNELVMLIVEDQRTQFSKKNITLHAKTYDDNIFIEADPVRIQQVVVNLLNNAYRYSRGEGGSATITTCIQNGEAIVSVTDNGIGLGPELIPNIFEPFTQADTSSQRNDGGLGIGLAITKEIVELHGGTIRAYSEGVGKGSEFFIHLPLCEALDLKNIGQPYPTIK